ncbi:MAG: glycosyltransferase family 2 protein [Clostridia bacterium]|nr:glycosyltransferase family 2 protein [Clostridia bacterium]
MDRKITGCIVTYNNMRTVGKAISTVLSCTKDDFTLFVVDNGSTDGTVEFIRENFPSVTVIESGGNIGFGAGHNFILDRLDSDYHAIINPDVILKDDIIGSMADYLDSREDVGMLSPRILFPDGREQVLGKKIPLPHYLIASRLRGKKPGKILSDYAMLNCDMSQPVQIQNATGCFMFIRTSLFKSLGGFDERYFMYFEDCDLTREVNKISKVLYYPAATVYHEWGRESKKSFHLKAVQIKSMFKYYAKWGLSSK